MEPIEFKLNRWPNHSKEWVAKIVKRDPRFKWDRVFCPVVRRDWSHSGKHGTTTVLIDSPGLYEVSSPNTGEYGRDARAWMEIHSDGRIEWIEQSEWLERLEKAFPKSSDR